MKQKFISLFLMLSLMLPMGIGLSHSFHDHDNLLCHSKSEFHIHADESTCNQLHYINHTLSYGGVQEFDLNQKSWFDKTATSRPPLLATTVLVTESGRGPPVINV